MPAPADDSMVPAAAPADVSPVQHEADAGGNTMMPLVEDDDGLDYLIGMLPDP